MLVSFAAVIESSTRNCLGGGGGGLTLTQAVRLFYEKTAQDARPMLISITARKLEF